MSGVGFSELIILFLIGLIVLGPERLPRVANQLGSWIGQARRMTRVMKRQLEVELDLENQPDIRPPKTAPVPANENDDRFSPAHDADSMGSGINNDIPSESPPDVDRGPDDKEDIAARIAAAHGGGAAGKEHGS